MLGALLLVVAIVTFGHAQETQDGKAAAPKWLKQRQAEFEEYEFQRESARPVLLVMESRSILNWSNPEKGTDLGGLFLWTHEGRPQMIACAFEWGGSLKHEFHSLGTEPVVAQRGGNEVHRFAAGIEWKPFAAAPEPAARRAQRLTQMRRLAERFRVTVGNKELAETRLLPQPVYHFPLEAPPNVAVFVFVQGTDPECTLLVEATPEKKWRYALARQTKWGLKAELDGNQVWDCTSFSKRDPESPFVVLPQKQVSTSTP
jgi:hypothetical protein